ncbi:ZIP zinc transporter family protein [Methylophaga frappieri]|uniref:ZIP zinc transporter family protein n=1 Tax=Methylophaga frappieri (strain ATCC BAA-2434 / DSM 25690 / JAM7) TaxID=754477 RepID=I1YHX3_METFJ|nr:divalent cation transporter [Methylophaga frappieri]AFJ02516.1 ZIP zinc transporter family protein [Methylophaga frappieri]
MPEYVNVFLLALLAGLAMPAGAILARADLLHPAFLTANSRCFIIAFGGGALFSAVALVLVPEGISKLSPFNAALYFIAGGFFFYWLEGWLKRLRSAAGQLVAMLSDFIPEAIALGTAFATGGQTGLILALMMLLQNLPEGFNAYEELIKTSDFSASKIIYAFSGLALIGPVAALIGYYLLADMEALVAGLMLFASAGILYLVFQDIAPESKLINSRIPALGAVCGFMLGLVGNMLIQ